MQLFLEAPRFTIYLFILLYLLFNFLCSLWSSLRPPSLIKWSYKNDCHIAFCESISPGHASWTRAMEIAKTHHNTTSGYLIHDTILLRYCICIATFFYFISAKSLKAGLPSYQTEVHLLEHHLVDGEVSRLITLTPCKVWERISRVFYLQSK